MKKSNNIKMYLYCISLVVVFLTMTFFSYTTSMRNNVSNDLSKINSNVENVSTTKELTDKKLDLPSFSPDVDLEYYREYYNNEEVIARLEIPNVFNLIITRTSDNEYYLNHSINKKSDIKGTEFMDYRVTPYSKQINIYGHNSLVYDLPFKKLENYLDESFYNNNKYILLQHDSGRRIYQIFSFKRVTTDYEHMTLKQTFLIGLSQALAFIPGVSRSGITMTTARAMGIKRESAAKYSFMLSAPIVLAATIFKAKDFVFGLPFFVGVLTSFIVGIFVIKFLLNYLKTGSFKGFAIYRIIFGLIIIAILVFKG